jgi:hypothetical protein
MVIRADSILQMVRKIAETYQELVSEGAPDKRATLEQIDQALGDAFRARPETLHMEVDQRIENLDDRLAAEVGRLFVVRAEVAEKLGHADLSDKSLELALRGLLEGAQSSFHGGDDEDETPIDLLRDLVRSDQAAEVMSADELAEVWAVAFRIEADRQHFPEAENALFHALEVADEPDALADEGLEWLDRLLELPDEVLEERGLPRDEVQAAIEELSTRVGRPPDGPGTTGPRG